MVVEKVSKEVLIKDILKKSTKCKDDFRKGIFDSAGGGGVDMENIKI
jgi:hypothetical protein